MKGGKAGRKRRSAGGQAPRPVGGPGRSKPAAPPRPASGPPKKGARKKPHFGGTSTTLEE